MKVICELFDYKSPGQLDNPKVVIENDGVLNNKIQISIDGKWAVVDAEQLANAISACTSQYNRKKLKGNIDTLCELEEV